MKLFWVKVPKDDAGRIVLADNAVDAIAKWHQYFYDSHGYNIEAEEIIIANGISQPIWVT